MCISDCLDLTWTIKQDHLLTNTNQCTHIWWSLNVNLSPPVSIYIRQSQNVQSFDPSGSTWFYMQKNEEVDFSHEKRKKNLYYVWERVIYTGKSFSVTRWRDEV